MISKRRTKLQIFFTTALASLAIGACESLPTARDSTAPTAMHITDWKEVALGDPMTDEENIHVTTLERTPTASHHLVRIRKEEPLHRHDKSDLTVFILQGAGMIEIGESTRHASTGDVIFIPRTAPHRFINYSPDVAVAYVVFSPPFDGKDIVPVRE